MVPKLGINLGTSSLCPVHYQLPECFTYNIMPNAPGYDYHIIGECDGSVAYDQSCCGFHEGKTIQRESHHQHLQVNWEHLKASNIMPVYTQVLFIV